MTALAAQNTRHAAPGLAIDLSHVSKTYKGKVRALRGIDMRVHTGEVFGLLGPNGAGKSTLVKILMTVIRPTEAHGTMLGAPIGVKSVLRRVGYLPEHHRFPDYLTGAQVVDFYGAMTLVPRALRRKRTAELLELVGMGAWAKKRVKSYSKGMRQRLGIAQALVNDPDLVLLDEPTDGVDPVGRRDIRVVLQHLKERGKTVFLNSHLLSELEMVCDRVSILVQGVVAQQGTLEELTRDQARYEIELAADPAGTREVVGRALPGIGDRLPGAPAGESAAAASKPLPQAARIAWHGTLETGEPIAVERNIVRVGTVEPERVQPVLDALRRHGATIASLRPVRPSLEDLFMQAVTDPQTGEVLAPGAAPNAKKRGRR